MNSAPERDLDAWVMHCLAFHGVQGSTPDDVRRVVEALRRLALVVDRRAAASGHGHA